mgnify:CR=1 FL=1
MNYLACLDTRSGIWELIFKAWEKQESLLCSKRFISSEFPVDHMADSPFHVF